MTPELLPALFDLMATPFERPDVLFQSLHGLLFATSPGALLVLEQGESPLRRSRKRKKEKSLAATEGAASTPILRLLFVQGPGFDSSEVRDNVERARALLGALDLPQRAVALGGGPLLLPDGRAWGLLLAEPGGGVRAVLLGTREHLEGLMALRPLLTTLIRDALNREALDRAQRLDRLAARVKPTHAELSAVVHELRHVFAADGVSLWLEELVIQGEPATLRLCATTVPTLTLGVRRYQRGEGLTGWVWKRGEPLLLFNRMDPVEVKAATREEGRHGPVHAEWTGDEHHPQVLMVPVREPAGRAIGVLRFSRRGGRPPFSAADEGSALSFADLLGAVTHQAVDRQVTTAFMQSHSELIGVSRQSGDGRGHRIVAMNHALRALIGRKRQGAPAEALYHPADLPLVRERMRVLRQPRKPDDKDDSDHGAGGSQREDVRVVVSDDDVRVVSHTLHRFVDARFGGEQPTEYIVFWGRDLSKERKEKAKLEALLRLCDDLGIAFFQSDGRHRTIFATKTQQRFLGWPEDEPKDRTALYPDPSAREAIVKQLRELRRNAIAKNGKAAVTPPLVLFSELRTRNGGTLLVHCLLRLVGDPPHEVVEGAYLEAAALDALAKELDLSSKQAVDREFVASKVMNALRRAEQFESDVAHQLIGPLHGLLGRFGDIWEEDEEGNIQDPKGRDLLGHTRSVYRLCESLLALEREVVLQSHKGETSALARVARYVAEDVQPLARQRGVRVDVDGASLASFTLPVQRSVLTQLVYVLLHNAVSYARRGSTVQVFGRVREDGRRELRVEDLGLPITDADRAHLFERGHRGTDAVKIRPAGTGIGLYLFKKILDTAGWTPIVESAAVDEIHARVCVGVRFPPKE